MDLASIDAATAIGDVIALAALVTSIVSIRKSNKAESLQAKVAELDAKLKAYELADAEEGRKACVEARAISVGKGRRLRICNVGKEPAREVDFKVLDKDRAGLVMRDHVPFPELEYQKSFDEVLITYLGLNPVFDVEVSWVDAEGSRQVKISHISL